MAVDLEPFKAVMNQNIIKFILLGGIIVAATFLKKVTKTRRLFNINV